MRKPAISPMDSRKQVILRAVVTDYVRTAEPVGSRMIESRYQLGVRSATIRNELAELADLGYLYQPHTSAGRVPSDLGYRYYVDRLMDEAMLSQSELSTARDRLTPRRTEAEIILEQTCRILSGLAQHMALATHPSVKGAAISHISVAKVAEQKLLAVLVLDNGRVLHELLEFEDLPDKFDSMRATNFLMEKLCGKRMESGGFDGIEQALENTSAMNGLLDKILPFLKREAESAEETDIHLEGASYIMQQPEFREAEKLEPILSVLERRKALYRLISSIYVDSDTTVVIGKENPVSEMRDCSFVVAKYRIGGRAAGTIGLLGPTRMDYRRAVGAVEFMAGNLSEMLTALSLS